jgi:hypothetical protein
MGNWAYNAAADAPNKGRSVVILGIVFHSISLIFVCLRSYVRLRMLKSFGVDDGIIIVTWVSSLTPNIPHPVWTWRINPGF